MQWMEYFVASGKLTEAKELGWDGKNPPPPGGGGGHCAAFAKCFGPSGGEEKRQADFVKALRNYEWELATSLASSAEEKQVRRAPLAPPGHPRLPCVRPLHPRFPPALTHPLSAHVQDVADSKNRVEWMDYHTAQGDMEEALTYAITSEERMRVESATKQAKVIG